MQGHFLHFQVKFCYLAQYTHRDFLSFMVDSRSTNFESKGGQCILLLLCDVGVPFLVFAVSSPRVGMTKGQAIYLSNSVKISNLKKKQTHGLYWHDVDRLIKKGKKGGEENKRREEPNTSFLTSCFLASATHSGILTWRIPWTEEPGGPWSLGSHRVGHDISDSTGMHISWLTSSTGEAYQFCDKMVLLQKVPNEGIWSRINKGQDSFKVDKCIKSHLNMVLLHGQTLKISDLN